MGKSLVAFAAGVALTSVAFVVFDRMPATSEPSADAPASRSPAGISQSNESLNAAESPAAAPPSPTTVGSGGLPQDLLQFTQSAWQSEDAMALLNGWSDDDLKALQSRAQAMTMPSQEMLDATRVMELARSELSRRELVATWAERPAPDLPIELPPEFSWLANVPNTLHEQLQREPVDPAWSLQMEANLRRYLTSRPDITGTYGIPRIACRTSGCEIAFVVPGSGGVGEDVNERRARLSMDISSAVRPLYEQPWASQLDRGQEYRNLSVQPVAATILVHIRRTQN